MAKLGINTGSAANDGTGDGLRLGGGKVNANFDEIYSAIGDGTTLRIGTGSTCAITVGESQVGIGSTIPAHLLDVRGGIGATNISISGIATVVGLTSPTISATTSTLVGSAVTTDSEGIRVAGVVTATSFVGKYFDGTVIGDVQVGTSLTAYSHGVVTSGIVTAQGGFITGSGTTAVQMSISGNNLLFTVVGIGTTHLVLVP